MQSVTLKINKCSGAVMQSVAVHKNIWKYSGECGWVHVRKSVGYFNVYIYYECYLLLYPEGGGGGGGML